MLFRLKYCFYGFFECKDNWVHNNFHTNGNITRIYWSGNHKFPKLCFFSWTNVDHPVLKRWLEVWWLRLNYSWGHYQIELTKWVDSRKLIEALDYYNCPYSLILIASRINLNCLTCRIKLNPTLVLNFCQVTTTQIYR